VHDDTRRHAVPSNRCANIGEAREEAEAAQDGTNLGPDLGVIDRSRGKEKAFYLLLPVDPVETNEQTSRRTTNWP
jgi:hypothetical protein